MTAPKKIVILGGGISALTAAFEMTRQPNWQDHYDITLYQMGWRLGGKCATARGPNARIEEHGIHGFLGCYYNALPLMADCYRALNRPAGVPLATFEEAFKPNSFVLMWEFIDGSLKRWPFTAPTNSLLPGDPSSLQTVQQWVGGVVQFVDQLLEPVHTPALSAQSIEMALELTVGRVLLRELRQVILAAESLVEHVLAAFEPLWVWLKSKLQGLIEGNDDLRRLYITVEFLLALVRGADVFVHSMRSRAIGRLGLDYAALRAIADEVGAILWVDMAHYSGLIAAGVYPNPIPHAHVTTSTTHKTLRGPRGGIILTNDEDLAKKLNSAIFPGTQGGPLMHIIAAKAVAFGEALKPEFKTYQEQVLKNADVLAKTLVERGLRIVSGGTESHLMLVDLRSKKINGKEAENVLHKAHMTCNKNAIPNDPEKPMVTSGIRLGSPAFTTRGFKEAEAMMVGNFIADVLDAPGDEAVIARVRGEVAALCARFPVYR